MRSSESEWRAAGGPCFVGVRWAAIVAAGLVLFGGGLGAQTVRGTVLQPDSTTRAVGVIVAAFDDRGSVVARALTGDEGGFELRVPAAGRYAIRLLRIGYRPTLIDDVDVPASGVDGMRAVLGAEAVVLSAVTVRSDNICGSTQDAGRVVAQLWEEARTALTATELSIGVRTLDVEWQAFQFMMDRGGTRARDQSVLGRRGSTERPFISASAGSLARDGYVLEDRGDFIYRAPDAAVLLSDEFAATHCFRVDAPTRTRPQWIGIAFTPTPAQGRIRELSGTLWLDRATSELRLLEFRYTNLPPESDDAVIGGYVEFARMPTGQWLVARWAIRTPHMAVRNIGGGGVPGGGREVRSVLAAVGVTGGELVTVRRGLDTLYRADQNLVASEAGTRVAPAWPSECGAASRRGASVAGTVRNAARPVPGAAVSIAWTVAGGRSITLSTVADDRGAFNLTCVAQGVPLTVSVVSGVDRKTTIHVPPASQSAVKMDVDVGQETVRRP